MIVFIDESGDPGFKLDRGSTPVFVTSMVIFRDDESALYATRKIAELGKNLGVRPEFKFNKCRDVVRDEFFFHIADCKFQTRAVVVQKDLIHSDALRTVKDSFYKFFIRMMMQNDGGILESAKVVIDGSGDRGFKREFGSYLRRHIPAGCVRKWEFKDSVTDPLIQLADMTAGCIARSYRADRQNADRWLKQLRTNRQLQNLWEFK